MSPMERPRRSVALIAASLTLIVTLVVPVRVGAAAVWTKNLHVSGAIVYQEPYYTMCTAAAVMTMLNTIASRDTGGDGFTWTFYRMKRNTANPRDYRDMTSIQWFEQTHDTLKGGRGTDAHGWRNALNYYGWGATAMTDPERMVYVDKTYSTFDSAVKGAVKAIARYDKPVGMVGWAGRHAQVMTGYVVSGEDPAESDNFSVLYVYVSDPLRANALLNHKISITSLHSGSLKYRYQTYREIDSPYDDTYTAGWRRSSVSPSVGSSQWYRKYVMIQPVRNGLDDEPNPDPSSEPTPSPTD